VPAGFVTAIAAAHGWDIIHLKVRDAAFCAFIHEDVYIPEPSDHFLSFNNILLVSEALLSNR
jgi:hypothetical protein